MFQIDYATKSATGGMCGGNNQALDNMPIELCRAMSTDTHCAFCGYGILYASIYVATKGN